jgi:hypothetical protein
MKAGLVARLTAVAVAVWLMAAPAVLGYGDPAQSNDRIVGPIAGAFAFVACWEILMAMRWPTVPLGAWLVLAPVALGYDAAEAWISSMICGTLIVATAFVGHDVSDDFGGGWRSVRPSRWQVGRV